MNIEINNQKLNEKDLELLVVVCDSPDPITASDLRERISWMDDTSSSTYRLNKLEQAELIETYNDDEYDGKYHLPPRISIPTDLGDSVVDNYDLRAKIQPTQTPETRIKELEEERNELDRQMKSLKHQYGALEDLVTVMQVLMEQNGMDVTAAWHEQND